MGTWPDWIAAVGTSFAFLIAAVAYFRDVKTRRESQARLVYTRLLTIKDHRPGELLEALAEGATQGISSASIRLVLPPQTGTGKAALVSDDDTIRVTAAVRNASDELIGPVKLQLVDTGRQEVFNEFCLLTAYIEPGSEYVGDFVFVNPAGPGAQPALGTTVIFRDASGQWWRRHLAEAIERVHADPENALHTPSQREQFAAHARAFGGTPTPDPRLARRVRFRRWLRKKRGRSPIP